MKKMSKMDAVGELVAIKKDLLNNISNRAARLHSEGSVGMVEYLEQEQEREKRWVLALDMAGKAMTR